jgi:hypothetical protein
MKKIAFAALLMLVCSTFASADQIFGSAGAGFQTWTTANLNENGTPFWDNTSADGPQKNIGYCMAGGGGCTISPLPGTLPYWGTASGGADTDVYFGNSGPLGGGATMLIEIAGLASTNQFGWVGYDPLTNSLTTGLNVIFTGSDSAGASATFTPKRSTFSSSKFRQPVMFTSPAPVSTRVTASLTSPSLMLARQRVRTTSAWKTFVQVRRIVTSMTWSFMSQMFRSRRP